MTNERAKELGVHLEVRMYLSAHDKPTPEEAVELDQLGQMLAAAIEQAQTEVYASLGWDSPQADVVAFGRVDGPQFPTAGRA